MMSVHGEEDNEIIWQEIGYVANAFCFALAGVIFERIIVEDEVFKGTEVHKDTESEGQHGDSQLWIQFLYAIALYVIMAVVRLGTIFIHYRKFAAIFCTSDLEMLMVANLPCCVALLRKIAKPGYAIEPREVFFMTFAGLRGAVSLCVALFVDHMEIDYRTKDVIMFHTCMCVAMTVLINGMTCATVYKFLGLAHTSQSAKVQDVEGVKLLTKNMSEFYKNCLPIHLEEAAESHSKHSKLFFAESAMAQQRYGLSLSQLEAKVQDIKDMIEIRLVPVDGISSWEDIIAGKAEGKPPLNDDGELEISFPSADGKIGLNKVWASLVAKPAWAAWRRSKRGDGEKRLTPNEWQVEHLKHHTKHKRDHCHTDGTVTKLHKTRSNRPVFTMTINMSKEQIHEVVTTIYLTALSAFYDYEREEGAISGNTLDYLERAIRSAEDHELAKQKMEEELAEAAESASATLPPRTTTNDETNAILVVQREVDGIVDSFQLHAVWSSPPVHKLQLAVSMLKVHYEALSHLAEEVSDQIESGQDRNHTSHTQIQIAIHQMQEACDSAKQLTLYKLADICSDPTNYTLMPVVNTYSLFRCALIEQGKHLKQLKQHGLISNKV
jgi:hypothetical protein